MTDKKRILFLANHFITLYSFRKEMIQRLVNDGHTVLLSLPESDENDYFKSLGCKIINTSINRKGINPIEDLNLIKQYIKILKQEKPDIVFSFTIKPNIYGAFANRFFHIKQVCNITGTGGTFLKKNLMSELCKILYRLSVKHSYKVFFQNTGDRDFFIRNKMVRADNYNVIPGSGCNISQHIFSDLPSGENINFIYIGRVMKLKGIDEYIQCAQYIRHKYPNTNFFIAGWNEEPEYMSKVKKAEEEGALTYLGFRKDIDECIKKCHCTILPSYGGEGVPNVLLESAANGRICIASRINGSKDVIQENVTGYLFEPGNAKDLIEQVEKVIHLSDSQRNKMGKAGRLKIENEFNREIVIQAYLNELE